MYIIGVSKAEKREGVTEKKIWINSCWKSSKSDEKYKPADLRSSMSPTHKKYIKNDTKHIKIKLLTTNGNKKILKKIWGKKDTWCTEEKDSDVTRIFIRKNATKKTEQNTSKYFLKTVNQEFSIPSKIYFKNYGEIMEA